MCFFFFFFFLGGGGGWEGGGGSLCASVNLYLLLFDVLSVNEFLFAVTCFDCYDSMCFLNEFFVVILDGFRLSSLVLLMFLEDVMCISRKVFGLS